MAGQTETGQQGAVGNRWLIAAAGVVMQLALGAVYAWSVFRIPLTKEFGWSISEVTVTFTLSIFFLGVSAVFGGLWMARSARGPSASPPPSSTAWGSSWPACRPTSCGGCI